MYLAWSVNVVPAQPGGQEASGAVTEEAVEGRLVWSTGRET